MADTRKKFGRGVGLQGFKPGQVPYMVGNDKKINGITTHITLDGFEGNNDKKVRSFHISCKDIKPQPIAKWVYNGTTNSYEFKGWANKNSLPIAAENFPAFLTAISNLAKSGVNVFGPGCNCVNATDKNII